jgi:hypothetical protein
MTPEGIHSLVVGTGRLSTAVFIAALLASGAGRLGLRSWLAFVAAQTVHFAAVLWFGIANGGRDLFPDGRSLGDAGGWPALLGIFAFFYILAFPVLTARRAGPDAGPRLRLAGRGATTLIGLIFLATYVPLIGGSMLFAMPVVVVSGALGAYLARPRCPLGIPS